MTAAPVQPFEAPAADPTTPEPEKPAREVYAPQYAVVDPEPLPAFNARPVECCGNCPGWKKAHPKAPFGQCLPAIRWLGAPMYTPDLAGCTLDEATKAKGATR